MRVRTKYGPLKFTTVRAPAVSPTAYASSLSPLFVSVSLLTMALRQALFTTARRRIPTVPIPRAWLSSAQPVVPGVGKGKTSTGLVGLAVDHEAVPKMIVKYQALLDKMAASDMPEDAHYRITVEKIARFRIQAAKDNPDDPEAVEELCNCGQVEELVQQADDEMEVLDMYLRNRWWEYVKPADIEYNPTVEEEMDDAEYAEDLKKNEESK